MKKIVLEELEGDDYRTEVSIPDVADLLDLRDAVNLLLQVMINEANLNPTQGNWGAAQEMAAASRAIHGAAGWLAKQEGLV